MTIICDDRVLQPRAIEVTTIINQESKSQEPRRTTRKKKTPFMVSRGLIGFGPFCSIVYDAFMFYVVS